MLYGSSISETGLKLDPDGRYIIHFQNISERIRFFEMIGSHDRGWGDGYMYARVWTDTSGTLMYLVGTAETYLMYPDNLNSLLDQFKDNDLVEFSDICPDADDVICGQADIDAELDRLFEFS